MCVRETLLLDIMCVNVSVYTNRYHMRLFSPKTNHVGINQIHTSPNSIMQCVALDNLQLNYQILGSAQE